MTKELVVSNHTFTEIRQMSTAIVRSGLFGVANEAQAISLLLLAQAEGLHPMTAARDYHIIKGRPSLKADTMLARFQQAGGKVEWLTLNDREVKAKFSHSSGGSVIISWTIEDADRAGLLNKKGDMWKKYPRQLLRSRVVSEGVRTVYPGVVAGAYTPEEIESSDGSYEDADYTEVSMLDKYRDGVDHFFKDGENRPGDLEKWLIEKREDIEQMSEDEQKKLYSYVDQMLAVVEREESSGSIDCPNFGTVTVNECRACKNANCEKKEK